MKFLIYSIFLLILSNKVSAQLLTDDQMRKAYTSGYNISISSGYSQISKLNDAFANTSNLGGIKTIVNISNNNNSVSQTTQKITGKSETVPFEFEISKYAVFGQKIRVFNYGVQFQTLLQKPEFFVPIRGTNDVAYKETLKSLSAGIFFQYIHFLDFGISVSPQIGFGKKWYSNNVEYSDLYKATNKDLVNFKMPLNSSFYVSSSLVFAFDVGNRTKIEILGRYFIRDYYQELNSLQVTNLTNWQVLIGLRKGFGFRVPCSNCKCY